MMTAAAANDANNSDARSQDVKQTAQQHFQNTARLARGFADDAGRAIGSLLPTASLQNLTARKYTLPDKTVASQVLMYRQLLHTKCRPGLKLSRNYEETAAQKAVMHMPWWEQGIEESRRMVISYDNLITRLWLNGAIEPFQSSTDGDLLSLEESETPATVETHMGEDGLPQVPHEFWVDRLGFQQPDPVTDFRSGGVLSLAMMVYMVESKPEICKRFFLGDTKVLPFGITCINVTDMIAKFLMLAKSTDRMDALLSQKPFWKMFGDPNAITAVQELAMSMLCDVAVELGKEKKIPYLAEKTNTNEGMAEAKSEVTVFDFSTILERTEKRVRDDLLGAGPKTVDELRSIERRLKLKYQTQLERKIERAKEKYEGGNSNATVAVSTEPTADANDQQDQLKEAMDKASHFAGGLLAKVKSGVTKGRESISNTLHQHQHTGVTPSTSGAGMATLVDLPPVVDTPTAAPVPAAPVSAVPASNAVESSSATTLEDGWNGTDIAAATDGISNFSIGDDDDDADLLL